MFDSDIKFQPVFWWEYEWRHQWTSYIYTESIPPHCLSSILQKIHHSQPHTYRIAICCIIVSLNFCITSLIFYKLWICKLFVIFFWFFSYFEGVKRGVKSRYGQNRNEGSFLRQFGTLMLKNINFYFFGRFHLKGNLSWNFKTLVNNI